MRDGLVVELRNWAQVHPRGSQERRLMHEAADELEAVRRWTVEDVEELVGGKLMTWQRRNVEAKL